MVIQSYSNSNLVSWKLKTRWLNCITLTRQIQFHVSHIYREDNMCVDELTNVSFYTRCFTWWDLPHRCIWNDFNRNRYNIIFYRFEILIIIIWIYVSNTVSLFRKSIYFSLQFIPILVTYFVIKCHFRILSFCRVYQ